MSPSDLSALDAISKLEAGELTATNLVRSCLERIDDLEDEVGAWQYLDRTGAIANAARIDKG
jgi:Asp-tRNA(Asn)/Glu-tRNA(Gln) amidotransferase A subunit family amidase